MTYLMLAGGLVLLIIGGELLVRGAATTAERLGMPPLLIGITLVGFGTSAPELVTSIQASLSGAPGIALGNIVGSNIANIFLILGIAALLAPIPVSQQALRRDGVIVLASSVGFIVAAYLIAFDRVFGGLLIALLVVYLVYAYRQEMAGAVAGHSAPYEKIEAHEEMLDGHAHTGGGNATVAAPVAADIVAPLAMVLGGLVSVVLGGRLLVSGAIDLARLAGVSETVIGLTIVAIGTSLPELVTSVIAAIRRHGDVALGNILGSNVYNILGIGGATAAIAPTVIPEEILSFDGLVMIAASVMLLAMARTGMRIGRSEGLVLLGAYGAYLFAVWPS